MLEKIRCPILTKVIYSGVLTSNHHIQGVKEGAKLNLVLMLNLMIEIYGFSEVCLLRGLTSQRSQTSEKTNLREARNLCTDNYSNFLNIKNLTKKPVVTKKLFWVLVIGFLNLVSVDAKERS